MSILDRSSSRDGARVRLLAVHTTEGNGTAEALRDATWWVGSSHAINDESGTLLTPAEGCVPYDRASWTLRSGNPISENIEQVGWAAWSRTDWLARPKLLDTTARWLADRSKARGIPLVKIGAADILAGKAGVIGHWDWTQTGDGTHTDPGPNYPWDVVLAKAKEYAAGGTSEPSEEDEMDKTIMIVKVNGGMYLVNFAAGTARELHPVQYGLLKQRGEVPIVSGEQSPAMLTGLRDPSAA